MSSGAVFMIQCKDLVDPLTHDVSVAPAVLLAAMDGLVTKLTDCLSFNKPSWLGFVDNERLEAVASGSDGHED